MTDSIWAKIAAPLPTDVISWRQDGKPYSKDGKYFARFVAYIDAQTVRERLDSVVPGGWDLSLELLPPRITGDGEEDHACAFKAQLKIGDVIREDVGVGRDYKQAASDALKRAAVRFGIGHELYSYEQNWVQVDGDGKYAKPVEDPAVAYARRQGTNGQPPVVAEDPRPTSRPNGESSGGGSGKRMSFGKHKGRLLTEVPVPDLESTVKWCREKDAAKFADLIDACQSVIADSGINEPLEDPDYDTVPF